MIWKTKTERARLSLLMLCLLVCGLASCSTQAIADARNDTDAPVTLIELRDDAIDLVQAASREEDPFLRANAIEAMQSVPERAQPMAQLGLDDDQAVVRFTALVTIGKMQLRDLGPAAKRLMDDPNASVRAAAMFAAKRCGMDVDISEMAELMASPDPSVRSNVVMLLGMMDDPSALPMIQAQSRVPMPNQRVDKLRRALVRVQVAEAEVRLGEQDALSPLRAAAYSEFDEVRVLAVTMLGRLRDASAETGLMAMVEQKDKPIELRLAAAAAVSQIGGRATVKRLMEDTGYVVEACGSDNPVLRGQAVMTAGSLDTARRRIYKQLLPSDPPKIWRLFESRDMVDLMARLMADADPQVKLSAAAAVLRDISNSGLSPVQTQTADGSGG